MTKEELRQRMEQRLHEQMPKPEGMMHSHYIRECIRVMFDVAAEAVVEIAAPSAPPANLVEPLNRKIARKIARQLDLGGWHDAAAYVESDFIATQISLVLSEAEQPA
jgi:hypothetical protein